MQTYRLYTYEGGYQLAAVIQLDRMPQNIIKNNEVYNLVNNHANDEAEYCCFYEMNNDTYDINLDKWV